MKWEPVRSQKNQGTHWMIWLESARLSFCWLALVNPCLLGDNSPWISYISALLVSRGTHCQYSGISLPGYLCDKHP